MGKVFKNISFFIVTACITAGIFWLVFLDNQSKENVLEYSLNMLGKKLMAMVPESEQKNSVKTLYDDFVQQTKAQEVAPEKVEQVAANILNLSNLDTTLTPEQAEAVIQYSLQAPVTFERIEEQREKTESTFPNNQPEKQTTLNFSEKQWADLGIRIQKFSELNDELKILVQRNSSEPLPNQPRLHYHIDHGLRIAIDPTIKMKIKNRKQLREKMRHLEKQRLLEWRKDFRTEMECLRRDMQSLRKLKRLEELEKLKELRGLGSLEALKTLEGLEFIPPVINVDSIQSIVNKSLKEAGIGLGNNKKQN
ncbi:hypothetical protein B6I21_06785 [candidate division KSB1 bacterium 4572_119]|nr:MAG: hypothetical protein B6I21_06785 [candidate division KSB1 bacterium 4572_119]